MAESPQITLIHGDAASHGGSFDMILTDPPYDMSGPELVRILSRYDANHLVLITTMRQLLDFMPRTDWRLSFDFVLDAAMPKKSTNIRQPHYTHQTGVYLTRPGVRSVFDRKRRIRSDTFSEAGYWPTIFQAPRTGAQDFGYAKNPEAITDLLGSFDIQSVCDPFAGSATTAIAAYELGVRCVLIERDPTAFEQARATCKFMIAYGLEIIE